MRSLVKVPCCFALLMPMAVPLRAASQVVSAPQNGSRPVRHIQAYSGTEWLTITHQLFDGSTRTTVQRTDVSRDAQGQWTRTYYRFTNGPQYDASAPVDHVDTGTTTSLQKSLAPSISNGEVLEQDEDLGTRIEGELRLEGRRRTFLSVGREPVAKHVLEAWYSPVLGVVVHSESHNFDGTVIVSDLTGLQVGSSSALPTQIQATSEGPSTVRQSPNQLILYRGLFSIVAHMERAKLAYPATQAGNMAAAEDSLRVKIGLSDREWQLLVTTAIKVDAYTEEIEKQARGYAVQKRAEGTTNGNVAQTLSATRAVLQQMMQAEAERIRQDVGELEPSLSAEGTTKIHAYLAGPLAASAQRISAMPRSGVAK